jgi:hypothetical protein
MRIPETLVDESTRLADHLPDYTQRAACSNDDKGDGRIASGLWTETTRRNILPSYQTFDNVGHCLDENDNHLRTGDSYWSWFTRKTTAARPCWWYKWTRTVPKFALHDGRPFPCRRLLFVATAAAAALIVLWTLAGTLHNPGSALDGSAEAYLDYTYDDVATNHSSQRAPHFVNDNVHIPTDALGLDESEWVWDHNVYYEPIPAAAAAGNDDDDSKDDDNHVPIESIQSISIGMSGSITTASRIHAPVERNLLIAQVAGLPSSRNDSGDSSDQDRTAIGWLLSQDDVLLDIVSRPNRAYARQWGRNYVRFRPQNGNNDTMSSVAVPTDELLLVTFFKDLLEQQKAKHAVKHPHHEFKPYDAVAVLPPGAIITDLDYDLLSLLPDDKLAALTGWNSDMSSDVSAVPLSDFGIASQVILLNLRHPMTESVVHHWWQALSNESSSSPFHAPENETWFHIVASTTLSEEEVESIVVPLTVAEQGLVLEAAPQPTADDNETMHEIKAGIASCIKMCASSTKSLSSSSSLLTSAASGRSNNAGEAARALLQYTADAVCYRYYPKCDIL